MTFPQDIMQTTKAWPFEQARALVKRLMIKEKRGQAHTGPVIFQTGYGPSGLPHIGTFGEVARTSMVRQAFVALTDGKYETQLIAFSDDLDGMRKIPDNVPNHEMLRGHMGKPLSDVPDPFGTHASFAAHNNARLCDFLDSFGFAYTFLSSAEQYRSGRFDQTLLIMLERMDKVLDIMLPTLGEDRRATYSPFLPISPTGVASANAGARCGQRHHRFRRRGRYETRNSGDGRPCQNPVEAGLGLALDGAKCRLRNGR